MTQVTSTRNCEGCDSGIQNEDIIHRRAGLVGGVLLCPDCVEKKRQAIVAAQQAMQAQQMDAPPMRSDMSTASPTQRATPEVRTSDFDDPFETHTANLNENRPLHTPSAARQVGTSTGSVYMPSVEDGVRDISDEPLSLIDAEPGVPRRDAPRIRSFSEGSTLGGQHNDSALNRPLTAMAEPATRVRTFHGKLTAAGLAHMDDLVNEWLDSNPDVYIKQSTSSIGVFEGKAKESHLVLTILY